LKTEAPNLGCADSGGAFDFLEFLQQRIQSGVALRLPPHFKLVFQQPAGTMPLRPSSRPFMIGSIRNLVERNAELRAWPKYPFQTEY
jgi:hypothetical protein